jgi:hypothetical protein
MASMKLKKANLQDLQRNNAPNYSQNPKTTPAIIE